MTTPSDDLEELLEAERDIGMPTRTQRQRMFARLEPLLVVPVAVVAGSVTATAAGESLGGSALGGMIKGKIAMVALSAAALGAVAGATGHAYLAQKAPSAPSLPVASVSRPIVAASAPAAALSAPEGPPALPSAVAPAPSPGGARQDRARPVGSLRAERLLLETASAALMRGDADSAIQALREHGRRFPDGALAEEREVLLKKAFALARAPR